MRIYKGEAGFELTTQSFLDLLEEDALDELINAVIDLEAADPMQGDYDGDMIFLGEVDLDGFDGDLSNLFDHITGNIDHFDIMSEEGFEDVIGNMFLSEEDMMDNMLMSNEDLRVKRIVERFRHIDASR
jgi:hypothetical protein